jgi:hypothetical protein
MNRAPTVKQIMAKLNKGPAALTPVLKKELQAPQPAWGEIQNQTQEYIRLVADLEKCEPPKGDGASWSKFTKEYATNAQALDDAVHKKDKGAALTAHGKITRSCAGCHRSHRG